MEPKFINEFSITLEMYKDWFHHPIGNAAVKDRKRGICLRVTLAFCGILMIVLGLLLKEFFAVMTGTVFLLIALFRLLILPNKIMKIQYDSFPKSNNSDLVIRKTTFSDEIICESGKVTIRYSYSEIAKTTEDTSYFYLFLNEDKVMRIKKDGFTLGTIDTFREFCNTFRLSETQNEHTF